MTSKRAALLTSFLCVLIGLTAIAAPNAARASEIKELVKKWNKAAAEQTVDESLKIYAAKTDKAKSMARDMAEQNIAGAKLLKAVHSKWGAEAEQKVATAIGADTAKDDDEAEETINGDRAILKYKNEDMSPLLLVKTEGEWKIDCDAYVTALGENLADGQKAMRAITAIYLDTLKGISSGDFPDANALAASLKKKIAAVG